MGRGSSKSGGGGGKPTPSGVTLKQFQQMTDEERGELVSKILSDDSIKVPDYVDDSDLSKIMYALGLNNKPDVVDDATFDALPGNPMYRTVYETGSMPPPTTDAIIDQIKYGDYTQMSGKGGSVYGRGLYFGNDLQDSQGYGYGEQNPIVMQVKVKPGAKIVDSTFKMSMMEDDNPKLVDAILQKGKGHDRHNDIKGVMALANGYDGWHNKGAGYTVIVNRGALATTKKAKKSVWQTDWKDLEDI